MKIKNAPLSRGPQRHAGLWYVKRQRGGQLAVQSWPRHYGGPKTEAAKNAQKVWGEANHHSTRPFSMDGAEAVNFSQGTPFLPRDILMKAAYGTLVEANFKDGRTLRSAREVATNAQILLDQITTTPGAMLLRTADEWVGLDPGKAGYALVSNGEQAVPSWHKVSGGGGGGGGGFYCSPPTRGTDVSTSVGATKLAGMTPLQTMTIGAAIIGVDWTQGGSYDAILLTGTVTTTQFTVGSILAQSALVPVTPAATGLFFWPEIEGTVLTAGVTTYLGLIRTDGVGTDICHDVTLASDDFTYSAPMIGVTGCRISTTELTEGQSYDATFNFRGPDHAFSVTPS